MLKSRHSHSSSTLIPIKEEPVNDVSHFSRSPSKKLDSRHSRQFSSFTPKPGMSSPAGANSPTAAWPSTFQEKAFGAMAGTPTLKVMNETAKRSKKTKKSERESTEPIEEGEKTVKESTKLKLNCDYASLIMCFPENIKSLSMKNSNHAFNAFRDLVKTTTNKYDSKRLEDILKANNISKSTSFGYDDSVDKRELMKKVLEYNKLQKSFYNKEISTEKRNILLPLIKHMKIKAKHPAHVKVLPSRKLYEDSGPVDMVPEERTSLVQSQVMPGSLKQSMISSSSAANLHVRSGSEPKISMMLKAYEDKGYDQSFLPVKNFKVFWAFNSLNDATWKPDVREGHTFTTVGKNIIMYGGLGSSLLDEVAIFDPSRGLWEKPQVTGDVPMSGRHGHTACEYKKNLIVFGGEHQFNSTLNVRECLNDTRMYVPEKKEWKHMKTTNQITPRRHHAATVHNHSMVVYGGINTEGHYMKDVCALSLKSFGWDKIEIGGDKEQGIAFHTITTCYLDRINVSSKDKDKEKSRNIEEGIYVFGGKNIEGKILNTIKVFTLDSKNPQWSYPTTKGIQPTARYNHTSLFYEPAGLLIIYGGRNDTLFESSNDICLNDIRFLSLDTLTWSQVTSHGDVPKVGRYRHAVASFGSKMLIFGGVEFHKYADDEVKSVELNQARIRKMVMDDNDMSHDRSKSISESLPVPKKSKRRSVEPYIPPAPRPVKQIVSYLPVPGNRHHFDSGLETDQVLRPSANLSQHERNILSRLV